MKQLFLVIGAPGSGKTTDAKMVAEGNPDIEHFSTGDLLREEIENGGERAKLIKSFIDNGNLVPIGVVIDTIVNAIRNCKKSVVIIDGYPRSTEQMQELDKVLENENTVKLSKVIEVLVSEETARQRVLGRARDDDSMEVFDNRMKVYNTSLESIKGFYKGKSLLHSISGERTVEEVVSDMKAFVESFM